MSEPETYMTATLETVDRFGKRDNLGDELLHNAARETIKSEWLNETQFFGFHVPEHQIGFFGYLRVHNNLNQAATLAIGWQGTKDHIINAELMDVRNYQSMAFLTDDLHHYVSPSSYGVTMEEPGKRYRLQFDDPARGNRIDVRYEATMEPVTWPTQRHFDQIMHCTGVIELRGKAYDVDCLTVRDRSWAEIRPEVPQTTPPPAWVNGAFGGDDGFCVTLVDDPKRNPAWLGKMEMDPAKCLKSGWLSRDGQVAFIRTASKLTQYPDRRTLRPGVVEMELTDTLDRTFRMRGTPICSCPAGSWVNVRTYDVVMRWERDDGAVGYGIMLDPQFTDFVNAMSEA